jgi:hypothetical protein
VVDGFACKWLPGASTLRTAKGGIKETRFSNGGLSNQFLVELTRSHPFPTGKGGAPKSSVAQLYCCAKGGPPAKRGVYTGMRRTVKHLAVTGGIFALLLGSLLVWKADYFLLPFASLEQAGRKASGHIYANSYNSGRVTHLVITRPEAGRPQSYLAWIEDDPQHGAPVVSDCEDWTTPPLPLFMFPDVNPPCIKWYAAEDAPPEPTTPKRNPKVAGRSLTFTANDGKRVTVRW